MSNATTWINKPLEDGYYWLDKPTDDLEIVEYERTSWDEGEGCHLIMYIGSECSDRFPKEMPDGWLWLGPIEKPERPSR